jgi:pimeloyl-ACP methyl ester carboxylesterase
MGATNGRIDEATLFSPHFLLVNLSNTAETVEVDVKCRSCGKGLKAPGSEPDQIALIPREPLRSHARYGVYWFRAAKQFKSDAVINTGSIFALMRLTTPLWKDNASTVPSVDVLTAALLEPLRGSTQELLAVTDARGIAREDVLLAWSFTTQTTSQPLAALRNKPTEWNLPTAVNGTPTPADYSALTTLSTFTGMDFVSKIRSMHEGLITSGLALSEGTEIDPATGLTVPTDAQFTSQTLAAPRMETLKFLLALPKVPKGPNGKIPVVIFQHGLGGQRRNAAIIANSIAKKGYAVIAIDAPFHGERSYCTADNQCASGACTNHRCPGGYLATTDTFTGTPDISGVGFASGTNPFATRDHFRQQIIDFAQLIRSMRDTTAGIGSLSIIDDPATSGVVETLDTTNFKYIGQSLGGIIGTMALAAIPEISAATLNVPGADPVQVTLTSPRFAPQKVALDTYLAGRGIPTGSQKYEEFMDTARWILDPADPQNFGRHLISEPLIDVQTSMPGPRKRPFVSWVEGDDVVPNPTTELLIRSITTAPSPASFKQQQYQGGDHTFLLNVFTSAALAVAAQTDAMNWVDQ